MKVFRWGMATVLAGAMTGLAGAPAGATEAPCAARTVSVADEVEAEGGPLAPRQLSFVVTATGCAAGSVEYATTFTAPNPAPWAVTPGDYTTAVGIVAWSRFSASSFTVTVPIVGDEWVELDENLTLLLRNPSSGTTISDGTAVGTIINDDLTLVGGESEPDCGLTAATTCEFTITLSRRVASDTTVTFTTSNGTASAGQEFEGVAGGVIVIPAGALSASAKIALVPGSMLVVPKYFYVNLVQTSVGSIGVNRLRLTIPAP